MTWIYDKIYLILYESETIDWNMAVETFIDI